MNYFLLFTGILISIVAAYYSIVGLAAIFAGAALSVMIMGSVLEVGKLVTASWLYQNWKDIGILFKTYLTFAVIVLMFITSMGIFGYLSKAHIDQTYSLSNDTIIIKNLEREIKGEEQNITNAQTNLNMLDRLVSEATPKDANYIRTTQRREREAISITIRNSSNRIKDLNTELTPLRQQSAALEAEVGPLKYVADFIYGESNQQVLEKAVRWVIIIIVLVFDPLAVLLIIAANVKPKTPWKKYQEKKRASANTSSNNDFTETNAVVTDGINWLNTEDVIVQKKPKPYRKSKDGLKFGSFWNKID